MIRTENLTKKYKNVLALDRLTLSIGQGEIFGYIGPNGAGKTTTIRVLSGLMRPTSGIAEVAGVDVVKHPRKAKEVVGYCPDVYGAYPGMRVWEYLDFFGAAFRIGSRMRKQRVEDVLAVTGTDQMRDYFMDSLSRGMMQRVGVARTLMHDPKVLFLDEPTSGLDPRARIEIRQLMRRLKEMGKTILVSSHILPELATVCDRVGIIEQGRLLLCDRVEHVLKQVEQRQILEIEVLGDAQAAAEFLKSKYPTGKLTVQEVVGRMVRLSFEGDDEQVAGLLQQMVAAGLAVVSFGEQPVDLEHVYLKVTAQAKAGERRVE
jgi:ABC-2 type transport system ATP-binding protein